MNQKGFTLIELIVIIVILGILAVAAVPKYIDMQDEAQQAAVDGLAGSLAAASGVNYGGCALVANDGTDDKCTTVASCEDTPDLLIDDSFLTNGYSITPLASVTTVANGETVTCTLTHTSGANADFGTIGAGN